MARARQRATFDEQRNNVRQLLRDRKNWLGGGGNGLLNMEELGPPGADPSWPLSAESIRRTFGNQLDRSDPECEYALTAWAESHQKLEAALKWLRRTHYRLWRGVSNVYPESDAGDRDYDWYKSKLRSRHAPTRQWAQQLLLDCEMGIIQLTKHLLDEDLYVRFPKKRTLREEKAVERENRNIYIRFCELKEQTGSSKRAYARLHQDTGLSQRWMEQIVQSQREADGLPRRSPGRPRKGAA